MAKLPQYHIFYSAMYDEVTETVVCNNEQSMLDSIDQKSTEYRHDGTFGFQVFYGYEVEIEPKEVVLRHKVKE